MQYLDYKYIKYRFNEYDQCEYYFTRKQYKQLKKQKTGIKKISKNTYIFL